MCKQPIERSVTRRSDDGWESSLFKELAGRGGHHRVIRCAGGMPICSPHEAASHVACRRACILIGLICSTIGRCRLVKKKKKSVDWSSTSITVYNIVVLPKYRHMFYIYIYLFAYYLFYTVFTRTSQKHASVYLKRNKCVYFIFKKIELSWWYFVFLCIADNTIVGKNEKTYRFKCLLNVLYTMSCFIHSYTFWANITSMQTWLVISHCTHDCV